MEPPSSHQLAAVALVVERFAGRVHGGGGRIIDTDRDLVGCSSWVGRGDELRTAVIGIACRYKIEDGAASERRRFCGRTPRLRITAKSEAYVIVDRVVSRLARDAPGVIAWT